MAVHCVVHTVTFSKLRAAVMTLGNRYGALVGCEFAVTRKIRTLLTGGWSGRECADYGTMRYAAMRSLVFDGDPGNRNVDAVATKL